MDNIIIIMDNINGHINEYQLLLLLLLFYYFFFFGGLKVTARNKPKCLQAFWK